MAALGSRPSRQSSTLSPISIFELRQLLFTFLENGPWRGAILPTRDHGKHEFYIAHGAGAEELARKLRFENVLILKTKPNSAPAKERVQTHRRCPLHQQRVYRRPNQKVRMISGFGRTRSAPFG